MKKGIYLLAIIAIIFSACGNSSTTLSTDVIKNPNTANGNGDLSKLPAFDFEQDEHDFGKIQQGEKVSFTFKFKNVGGSDLVISDAKATCGCTVADYPKTPIKPGDPGQITVSFNSEGKKGIQNKTVTVIANTQPNTKTLTIKAEIIVNENN
ncbi:MAG: DUF1573 domain-containing protein [Bacteroidota bacterium]